ncbi:MAG: NUDIX hydrolase, partial [Quisquiliibacterium sp.]
VLTPPRHAASVILLRDGPQGLEVLLLRRHGESDAFGGAYVFPGGKLDAEDSEIELLSRLDTSLAVLHEALGEPEIDATKAAGLFVAAVRETFEEAGILLAPGIASNEAEALRARLREGFSFGEALGQTTLKLAVSAMHPWSRWITPKIPSMTNKRFDTRFFAAEVPPGLQARHDEREATEAWWSTPRTALERYWGREIVLAPPQIQSLAHLARHASVASALAEAGSRRPPIIQPEPFESDGVRVIAYPGDDRHPVRERAMPGPSRLSYRQGRFEPEGGFDAFFG